MVSLVVVTGIAHLLIGLFVRSATQLALSLNQSVEVTSDIFALLSLIIRGFSDGYCSQCSEYHTVAEVVDGPIGVAMSGPVARTVCVV